MVSILRASLLKSVTQFANKECVVITQQNELCVGKLLRLKSSNLKESTGAYFTKYASRFAFSTRDIPIVNKK